MHKTSGGQQMAPGGSVHCLAINSSGDIFAGTDGSGVYRSTDNGNNWIQANNNNLSFSNVYSIAIDNSSGDIFAGTYGSGVFRSTDNGNNWTQINSGLTNINVLSLLIDSSGYVIAVLLVVGYFVQRTMVITGLITAIQDIATLLQKNNSINSLIFAGTNAGIYRSTDNGNNWTHSLSFVV